MPAVKEPDPKQSDEQIAYLKELAQCDTWFVTASHFAEVVQDPMLFLQALNIEQLHSYSLFFSSKHHLVSTPFEDRLHLLVSNDVESVTQLHDPWR
jgi:hypothetical protein